MTHPESIITVTGYAVSALRDTQPLAVLGFLANVGAFVDVDEYG